ncbi:hypothetical protein IEQ34_022798 [Dendrobium chrysotoxum]|uniref:Uncharacterized protein n=1 Tax=Dendrobium chrysotoxum TaxID=161865 RepID=A0AAV7G002_DENCH|nr:hypothetical protein IEQ34_022798 [Dendrobium chrysotoxum]
MENPHLRPSNSHLLEGVEKREMTIGRAEVRFLNKEMVVACGFLVIPYRDYNGGGYGEGGVLQVEAIERSRWLDNQIIGEGSSINNAYSTKHRWWDSAKENNRPREMSRRNGELMTWSRKANRLLRVEIGSSDGGVDNWVPKAYRDINCVCKIA